MIMNNNKKILLQNDNVTGFFLSLPRMNNLILRATLSS